MTKLLEYEAVAKSFFGVPVLHAVSFTLDAGRVLGLIGENGAGKSTLMNILGGVTGADSGRITLSGQAHAPRSPAEAARAGIAFIHQELNLFPNLSVAENLLLHNFPKLAPGLPLLDKRASKRQAAALLTEVDLQVSPETPVAQLSQGERQLVEIAKALGLNAKIIIFDEPTTSLTAREKQRLFEIINRLRARGAAIIYISHVLEDVLALCDDIVVLRDGAVIGAGPRHEFTVERMITLMVGRTLDQLYPARGNTPGGESVLEVREVSQPGVVKDVSFTLHRGEILGLSGLMGAGRSELARILFGLDAYERGEILLNGERLPAQSVRASIRRKMAFLTENRREEGLLPEATISENVALVSLESFVKMRPGVLERKDLDDAVRKMSVAVRLNKDAQSKQQVQSLSGGNQQKVVIAKWLLSKPSVFIMDEPTRGIDVGAKQEIYRLINDLADAGAGMLVISSEIEELIGLCDRIMVMRGGEITAMFDRAAFDRERILAAAFQQKSAPTLAHARH